MLLSELNPKLVFINPDGTFKDVETLAESQALVFECPCDKCQANKEFPHETFILNENATQEGLKWIMTGELENLTVAPSILFKYPCGAHFYIRDGEIQMC